MINARTTLPVGVFDSGIGGISVLAEMVRDLPGEKFIYLADSAHAPYGSQSCERVRDISLQAAGLLVARGIKALVVACNTATSVAINCLRMEFDLPVIGMEPALKPAVEMKENGLIVVMATPLTLQEEKFHTLYRRYNHTASIVPLPCDGLVELIETEAGSAEIEKYLKELFRSVPGREISIIVLGCTHYCFIRDEIARVTGSGVRIIDGNAGTVRHLKNTLQAGNLLAPEGVYKTTPEVEFLTTGDRARIIPLCRKFLEKSLKK